MSIPQTTREYRLPKVDGFHNLTLVDSVPILQLKATELLVKFRAVSFQYRDLIVAKGEYPLPQKENLLPGSDAAGEIVALDAEVSGCSVGGRVCSNFATDHVFGDPAAERAGTSLGTLVDGVLTEYKVLPVHALVHIPEHLRYEEASSLPAAAVTAYNALLGLHPLKRGDTVLVQGTGSASVFGLQLAVSSGATVIVTSSSDEKLKVAKELGAAYTINYKQHPDWDEEVLKIVGGPGTIIKSVKSIRFGGTVSVIGFVAGDADVSQLPALVLSQSAIPRGIIVGSQFENMHRFISAVKLRLVISKVFPFEEAREAYEYKGSQKDVGKVIAKVSKD